MPIYKLRLSRAEEAIYSGCLRQLQAEGQYPEIPEEWLEHSRTLDIVLGPESHVFETHSGGTFYAARTVLVARSALILTGYDIITKWDDQIAPYPFFCRGPVCRLGGEEYRQCELLNLRIENNLRLRRGQLVEGWLLFAGSRRVPAEYGAFPVPFEIVLLDQFGHEYCAEGRLSVSRKTQQYIPGVRPGTLDGLDATQEPRAPSIEEESRLRHREEVARERMAKIRREASIRECKVALPGPQVERRVKTKRSVVAARR